MTELLGSDTNLAKPRIRAATRCVAPFGRAIGLANLGSDPNNSMFASEILNGTPLARERHLNILRTYGSLYPYELVKAAGEELATAAPYQAIVARMNSIMDQIEAIHARRK